jgi:hypothetical protein
VTTTAVSQQTDLVGPLDGVAALARAGVERWARFVRPLPFIPALEEHRLALRSLVDWYERVCADDGYMFSPPPDGLNALSAIASAQEPSHRDPVETARGAVRVASALVDYRNILQEYREVVGDSPGAPQHLKEGALRQLESAAQSVKRFLDSPC